MQYIIQADHQVPRNIHSHFDTRKIVNINHFYIFSAFEVHGQKQNFDQILWQRSVRTDNPEVPTYLFHVSKKDIKIKQTRQGRHHNLEQGKKNVTGYVFQQMMMVGHMAMHVCQITLPGNAPPTL